MVLEKIGCPKILLQLIVSFHDDMKATIQSDGSTSDGFNINSGVKQGCVLPPTLFSTLLYCCSVHFKIHQEMFTFIGELMGHSSISLNSRPGPR